MTRPYSKITMVRRPDGRLLVKTSWHDKDGRHFYKDTFKSTDSIILILMEEISTVGLAEVECFLHTSRRYINEPHFETVINVELPHDEIAGSAKMVTTCLFKGKQCFRTGVSMFGLDEDNALEALNDFFDQAIEMYGTGNHHIIVN